MEGRFLGLMARGNKAAEEIAEAVGRTAVAFERLTDDAGALPHILDQHVNFSVTPVAHRPLAESVVNGSSLYPTNSPFPARPEETEGMWEWERDHFGKAERAPRSRFLTPRCETRLHH